MVLHPKLAASHLAAGSFLSRGALPWQAPAPLLQSSRESLYKTLAQSLGEKLLALKLESVPHTFRYFLVLRGYRRGVHETPFQQQTLARQFSHVSSN